MSTKIIVRFDDICPNLNWEIFLLIKNKLQDLGIRSLLGVIPDNQDKSFLSEVSRRVPLSRLAYPNELKEAIRFLISSENSFCTGQNIIIDGGRSII